MKKLYLVSLAYCDIPTVAYNEAEAIENVRKIMGSHGREAITRIMALDEVDDYQIILQKKELEKEEREVEVSNFSPEIPLSYLVAEYRESVAGPSTDEEVRQAIRGSQETERYILCKFLDSLNRGKRIEDIVAKEVKDEKCKETRS